MAAPAEHVATQITRTHTRCSHTDPEDSRKHGPNRIAYYSHTHVLPSCHVHASTSRVGVSLGLQLPIICTDVQAEHRDHTESPSLRRGRYETRILKKKVLADSQRRNRVLNNSDTARQERSQQRRSFSSEMSSAYLSLTREQSDQEL